MMETKKDSLVRWEKALGHRNRMQKDVSHDIRNSLQTVDSAVEILRKKVNDLVGELAPEMADVEGRLEQINDIFQRLSRGNVRIRQLATELDHAQSGLEVLHFERVNLKILLKNIVEEYQGSRSMGVRVYELSFLSPNMVAVVDQKKLIRVMDNLLNNATKYTEDGLIIVEVIEQDGEWEISVKDSGCGIPKSQLSNVFQRHSQVGGANQKEGAGIGLSIVRNFVDMHRGRIQVSSIPGKRTVFKINLPQNLPLGNFHVPVDKQGGVLPGHHINRVIR